MGAGNSAIADNTSYFQQKINIQANIGCTAELTQTIENNQLSGVTIDCGDKEAYVGVNFATQDVNCNNNAQIVAAAKAASMQAAQANVNSFLAFLNSADTSNTVSMQTDISTYLQSRCNSTINQAVRNQVYTGSTIKGNGCKVLANTADQKFMCLNDILADVSTNDSASQTATSTVTGLDSSTLLLILLVAIAVVFLGPVMIGKLLFANLSQEAKDQFNKLSGENSLLEGQIKALGGQV